MRILLGLITACLITPLSAASAREPNAILIDKKKNELHFVKSKEGAFEVVKSFHVTLGKVQGDKEIEGDQKTPEGIYIIQSRSRPPKLQPKFGVLGFYLNYPNAYDKIAGRTGSQIMLHATNDPDRLQNNFDSDGCAVLLNEEIEQLDPHIRLGLTPILIFAELLPDYMKPLASPLGQRLKHFFESWVAAWEAQDIEKYISHYHSAFSAQGMDRDQWKSYKSGLNKNYKTISIGPEDMLYYRHPKYSMITFTQNYRSTLRGGGVGHRSRGSKILFVAEEDGAPKIIAETYTTVMW